MNGDNDKRKADAYKRAYQDGLDAAKGADSLAKMAGEMVKGAHENYLAINSGKRSKGDDDVTGMMAAWTKGRGKAVHEKPQSAGSKAAQDSKMRVFGKMGLMTTIDPVAQFDVFKDVRETLIAEGVKTKSAYPGYYACAVQQIKLTRALTADECRAIMLTAAKADATLEKELAKIKKNLERIVSGERNTPQSDSDHVVTAIDEITALISEITAPAQIAAAAQPTEQQAALGFAVVTADELAALRAIAAKRSRKAA